MHKREAAKETLEDKIINPEIRIEWGAEPDPIDRVSMLAQIKDFDPFEDEEYLADISEIKTFLINFINKQAGIPSKTKLTPKKCPFCGSVTAPRAMDYHEVIGRNKQDNEPDEYVVCCSANLGGCGASGGVHLSRREALEAWNLREEDLS